MTQWYTFPEPNQADPLLFDINQVNFSERKIRLVSAYHISTIAILQAGTDPFGVECIRVPYHEHLQRTKFSP